jgi:hypothetical protein
MAFLPYEEGYLGMEIRVRNMDPVAVRKLDEMAKKKDKNMSRNTFLKNLLESIAATDSFKENEQTLREIETSIQQKLATLEYLTREVHAALYAVEKEYQEGDKE